jgi:hypothetical protein
MSMPIAAEGPRTGPPPLPVVSPDVWALAEEKGVKQYLPAVLDLLPRLFPNASRFAVSVDEDPEIASERNIIFDVDLPDMETSAFRAAYREWHDGTSAIVPGPETCTFRLSLNLQE